MARGWESKSVEQQIESASDTSNHHSGELTPEQQEHMRQRQGLLLSRARVVSQLEACQNERYAELLKQSLAEIDSRLKTIESKS